MNPQLGNILLDCLQGTVNVLAFSNSLNFLKQIDRLLAKYSILNLIKVESAEDLIYTANNIKNIDILLIDENYYKEISSVIVKTFENCFPILVVQYPQENFCNANFGARIDEICDESCFETFCRDEYQGCEVDAVCNACLKTNFLSIFKEWSIKGKLFYRKPEGFMENAVTILFEQNPYSVNEWASLLDITTRKFQRCLKNYSLLSPKKFIALYHVYNIAFSMLSKSYRIKASLVSYLINEPQGMRIVEYVLTRRSSLLA